MVHAMHALREGALQELTTLLLLLLYDNGFKFAASVSFGVPPSQSLRQHTDGTVLLLLLQVSPNEQHPHTLPSSVFTPVVHLMNQPENMLSSVVEAGHNRPDPLRHARTHTLRHKPTPTSPPPHTPPCVFAP